MAGMQFVVADDDGNAEGVHDPLETVEDDPIPAKPSRARKTTVKSDPAPKRPVGRPAKSVIEKEVADEFDAYLKMIAMTWGIRDADCAGVLAKQSKPIADSLAAILAKNPKLLDKFRNMTGLGDWGNLLFAILPVVKAVNSHHIAPAMKKESNGPSKAN